MTETLYTPFSIIGSGRVTVTSEAGDKLAEKAALEFSKAPSANKNLIMVWPEKTRQTLQGIGTSFTESSAFVLAHLEIEQRNLVMARLFAADGANFSVARTPIGATDFCVEGRYSYADVSGDEALAHFSIEVDSDGFDDQKYPGVRDPSFDLLPMIKQAQAIKSRQDDTALAIMASAWTAPAWMKDIEDWYQPAAEINHFQGGGELKPEYQGCYADYLIRYLEAYREQGVSLWAISPVNEPGGNSGKWESMHFSAESQRDFIKHHLGPKLANSSFAEVELFILDHSRLHLNEWCDVIYNDSECAKYVSGAAVHWYESSFKVYEEILDQVNRKYPGYSIIHSEGCIDDLGNDAPEGVLDPNGYKESGWFDNDDFWWNANASDWAYSVTWEGVTASDHPMYTPVHRYARNIINSLNHWVSAWIDWNCVLDARGGPNHVGNYCGAPIMVDTDSAYVYYTPVYYILAQLSRSIRPGDRVVQTEVLAHDLDEDAIHTCASINQLGLLALQILNTTKQSIELSLQIGSQFADLSITANALVTVQMQLVSESASTRGFC